MSRSFPPTSRTLYRGEHVAVGSFRCPTAHPNFGFEGTIGGYEFVFPRSSVWIRRPGLRAFVADANVVTLYNRGQEYSRAALAPTGDNSDWFAVDEATARDVVRAFDPAAEDPHRLLRFPSAPSDPALYLRQRRLFEHLRTGDARDESGIEEEVIDLLGAVLRRAYAARDAKREEPAVEHSAVTRAKQILALRFREAISLHDLARCVGLSTFHLARTFRRVTGCPLHAWRTRLRLLTALDELCAERRPDLTELALDLGFSSHSHFTATFRSVFGVPPSELRAPLDRARRAELVGRLPFPLPEPARS